jgi:diacylglycerol kinase (ATP)
MGKFLTSFKFAWRGILAHFGSQTNARVQLGIAVLVIICGLLFGIRRLEWCAIVLCISLVFAAEALNTAIEALADALHPDQHPLVGKAKDVAAGAVLFCVIGAVIVGVIIFSPYLGIGL